MSWAAGVLLVIAAVTAMLSCLGLVVMEDFFDRLHYLAPVAVLATGAVAAAIVVEEGFSGAGIKALLVLLVMVISNPVLTHAGARACQLRRNRKDGKG